MNKIISLSTISALALGAAYAQDIEDDVIVIEGQRRSLENSIASQRNDDGIISVLSADDIANLPDENVAEAARRTLGVSIANDQGEGRFVTVRGINSQLNATSVNGVRLTSPEAGDRRVALDVIDADVLQSVTIRKTLSADMDADAIGASIELKTISGLNRKEALRKIKIGTIYSELSEEFGPKVSGTYANNFNEGRFGIALNGSFQSREFASDNKEVDGSWVTGDVLPYPEEELEFRNYDIERERLSLAANFDYALSDESLIYLHTLYNKFSDHEFRSRTEIKVEDASFGFDTNTVLVGTDGGAEFEIDRDIKDRLEEQTVFSVVAGFEKSLSDVSIDGSIAFTHAAEEEPNRLDVNFDQTFDVAGNELGIDVSDTTLPRLVFTDTTTQAAFLDPSGYDADKFEFSNGQTEDEEVAITFNLQKEMMFGENPGFLKTGFKARFRDKSYDLDFQEYGYEGSGDTLANFATSVDYPLDVFGPAPDPSLVRAFFEANRGDALVLELDTEASFEESFASSFAAEEDVLAGYIMGQVDIDKLRLTGGVRVEQSDVTASTNIFDEDTPATPITVTAERDYTDVLPSISAKYAYTDQINIRASYYASIIRPNFSQFVPAGVINDDDELEIGNFAIERTEANNFDFLIEYYPSKSAVIQGGVFYKDLSNLITDTSSDIPGTINGIDYQEIESFTNVNDAEIWGIELGYQQALDYLPAPYDGLIVAANYTYADSEANLDGNIFDVPGQSKNIFNLVLGYDKGPLDLRAAYSFKGENVDDVDSDLIGPGRVILDQSFLDLSAKVRVSDSIKLYGEVKNVLDTPLEVVTQDGGRNLLSQYDDYGYTVQAGLIAKF